MSRLLHDVAIASAGHRLSTPTGALDAATAALVAEREQAAYEQGHRDGATAAAAAAQAAAEQMQQGLAAAVQEVARLQGELDRRHADELVAVAARVASAVLGREPGPDSAELLRRVAEALRSLDHGPFVVHTSPGDADAMRAGLDSVLSGGTTVSADPGLAPGEARVTGPWSQVDLTRAAMLRVVVEALEEVVG